MLVSENLEKFLLKLSTYTKCKIKHYFWNNIEWPSISRLLKNQDGVPQWQKAYLACTRTQTPAPTSTPQNHLGHIVLVWQKYLLQSSWGFILLWQNILKHWRFYCAKILPLRISLNTDCNSDLGHGLRFCISIELPGEGSITECITVVPEKIMISVIKIHQTQGDTSFCKVKLPVVSKYKLAKLY